MSEDLTAKFRFSINNQDPDATEADIRKRVEVATTEAVAAMQGETAIQAQAELEGGIFGLGETAVVLAVWHLTKAGAALFAGGAVSQAGKEFYTDYLAPRLRKANLIPSKFEELYNKLPKSETKSEDLG